MFSRTLVFIDPAEPLFAPFDLMPCAMAPFPLDDQTGFAFVDSLHFCYFLPEPPSPGVFAHISSRLPIGSFGKISVGPASPFGFAAVCSTFCLFSSSAFT